MRVLVTGGRDYGDAQFLNTVLTLLHRRFGIAQLVHGAQRGADTLAHAWALANGVAPLPYPAQWGSYAGTFAGRVRNGRMLREARPDLVVGFTGGRGTAHMLSMAKEWGYATLDLRGKTLN